LWFTIYIHIYFNFYRWPQGAHPDWTVPQGAHPVWTVTYELYPYWAVPQGGHPVWAVPQGEQPVWVVPQGPQGSHPVRQNVPGGNNGCGTGTIVGPHGPWQTSVGVKYNIDGAGQVL